jgi:long-chain acyl-CoA synthetase
VSHPTTIVKLFSERIRTGGDRPAIHFRRGLESQTRTWREVGNDVGRVAATLVALDVQPGDRVVLVSPNRYEWIVCDLAIQMARAVNVPIHASLAGQQIAWQIADSGARIVFLSGPEQAEKLAPFSRDWDEDMQVFVFDHCPEPWEHCQFRRLPDVMAKVNAGAIDRALQAGVEDAEPNDLATILYTSGTTGEPKGVMLTQNNLASNAIASCAAFHQQQTDTRLSWLPFSHIFARTCDIYTWICSGSELALSESPEKTLENCLIYRPTLLNGVPYFFEKVMRSLHDEERDDVPGALQEKFGGRLRSGISGGAPLPEHVESYYQARGVDLVQGYGLTETSPVITTETPTHKRLGTVGPAVQGVEIRIADDGEVQTRGPHVMRGYWKNPEATAEAIQAGWFRTGDLGEIDAEGFLKITGRKKDLIVTSGGKNIAPVYLESLLKADALISQVVVIGDGRNYLTALVVPNFAALQGIMPRIETHWSGEHNAVNDPKVRKLYAERIDQRLAGVSRYEQIGNFTLLDKPFSVDSGELTLTLKLRRNVIHEHYAAQIEAMYAGRCSVEW